MFSLVVGAILQYFVATSSAWVISPLGSEMMLARHEFSLSKRYEDSFINSAFKKNILLTVAYMRGLIKEGEQVNWSEVEKPFVWRFRLEPGKTISYHDIVFPRYKEATPLTTAHFTSVEGFVSDGYLVGDGTCHFASLLSWVAKDAGLAVEAPTNHDFAPIPEVPKEQGVSIYSNPYQLARSERQNLYIQNTLVQPVELVYTYDGDVLGISAEAGR